MHIRTAASYLDQISATIFRENGQRYLTPSVRGYDNTVMTGCGRIEADNAYACRSDGTTYYDRTFLAGRYLPSRLLRPRQTRTPIFSPITPEAKVDMPQWLPPAAMH
ncbi:MAG: hypothetical protein ABJC63_09135 [Gemmatimonadales bacterium]